MAIAALVLIFVYVADIMYSIYFEKTFLPIDPKVKGILISTPAAVLQIITFFSSRKMKSRLVGVFIFATGIMMMSGVLVTATLVDQNVSDLTSFLQKMVSFLPIVGLGMFIVILGLSKLSDS